MAKVQESARKVPLEVLSLGVSRTGTETMKRALELLGYPRVGHGIELSYNDDEVRAWRGAVDAKFFGMGKPYGRDEFDAIMGQYAAVTDAPFFCFADDLVAAYPEAKVVLVEREIESWYASFDHSVIRPVYGPIGIFFRLVCEPLFRRYTSSMFLRCYGGYFGAMDAQEIRNTARKGYRAHNEHVRSIVPPERLLNFDLASGWKPLCDFLGKEVPNAPFPHANSKEAHDAYQKERVRALWLEAVFVIGKGAAIVALLSSAVLYGRRYLQSI